MGTQVREADSVTVGRKETSLKITEIVSGKISFKTRMLFFIPSGLFPCFTPGGLAKWMVSETNMTFVVI
jgi:hypothetical protein